MIQTSQFVVVSPSQSPSPRWNNHFFCSTNLFGGWLIPFFLPNLALLRPVVLTVCKILRPQRYYHIRLNTADPPYMGFGNHLLSLVWLNLLTTGEC